MQRKKKSVSRISKVRDVSRVLRKNSDEYYHTGGSLIEKGPWVSACSPWVNQRRISPDLINLKLSISTVYCDYLIRQAVSESVFPQGVKGSLWLQKWVFLLLSSVVWPILSKINTSFSPISCLRLSWVFKCMCTTLRQTFDFSGSSESLRAWFDPVFVLSI